MHSDDNEGLLVELYSWYDVAIAVEIDQDRHRKEVLIYKST